MPYWEFLIQRETDRAWRPLTSRNLQVSEGKYRIIANTSMITANVCTQVFYQNDRQPPELSQKRNQAVTPEGMLVVLPFTHLQMGVWHFNCNVNDGHCEQLRLKVVPRATSAVGGAAPLETEIAAAPAPLPSLASERPPTEILETAVADLDRLLIDLDRPPAPTIIPAAGGLSIEQPPLPVGRPLQLDHEIFPGVIGRSLMVTGFVNLDLLPPEAHQLVAIIRQPQDGSVVSRCQQPLTAERQFAFQMPIELPDQFLNHFLMGEVAIVDAADLPLMNSNFTIAYEQPIANEELEDPFAVAFQIVSAEAGLPQQNKQPGDLSLQEILAATELQSILDPDDLPMNSYEASSYEVVVED
jgi:hypothetical protein